MKKALILVCAASALTACTSLQTKHESHSSGVAHGLKGMPYSLPRTDYQVAVTWMLSECPNIDLDLGDGQKTTIAVRRRLLSATAAATPQVTAGERFIVDYEKLQSWVKTTSFSIETHPNGVLKSINAAADDQSDEILQAAVETAITLLPLAGAASSGVAVKLLPTAGVEAARNAAGGRTPAAIAAPPPSIPRLELGAPQKIVVCTAQARETLQRYRQSREDEGTLAQNVESARQAVEDLRVVVAQRTVLPEHLTKLEDALATLRSSENALKKQKALSVDLAKEVSVPKGFSWPWCPGKEKKPPETRDCTVEFDADAMKRMGALFMVADVPLVGHEMFKRWVGTLTKAQRDRFDTLNPGVVARFFDTHGRLEPEPEPISGCSGTPASVAECMKNTGKLSVTFEPAADPAAKPLEAANESCDRLKRLKPQETCSFPVEDYQAGIFYRTPAEGTFSVKPAAGGKEIFKTPATVPQFGQLRFLPFRSRMFETGAIGLVLRPDGTLERFSVGQTEAAGLKAAKAADGVATSYAGYVEEQRNKGLAALQREIDLKTKQLDLLRLDATLSTQAITAQTNALLAEIALLKAELDRLKSERELSEARSGT